MGSTKENDKKITRRNVLKIGAGAIVLGTAAAAGVYYYRPQPLTPQVTTAQMTATVPVTTTITAPQVSTGPWTPPNESDDFLMRKAQALATAKPGDRFLIANITYTTAVEVIGNLDKGGRAAASALGLDYKTMDVGFDPNANIEATRSMIAAGAKGIVAFPPDGATMMKQAQLCQDNKVFYISYWMFVPFKTPDTVGDYFMQVINQNGDTDEVAVNTLLFQKMKEEGKGAASIIHLQGTPHWPSNGFKNYGIWRTWHKYPDLKLYGHQYTGWTVEGGSEAADETIALHPDCVGAVSVNDGVSAGAVLDLEKHNIDAGPYTTGVDGAGQAIKMMQDDRFFAVASFEPFYLYGIGIGELYDAITGQYYIPSSMRLAFARETVVVKDPAEAQTLCTNANFRMPFQVVSAADYITNVLDASVYPWDYRRMSRGKCKELGLQYDPKGGYKTGGLISTYDVFKNEGPDGYSKYIYDIMIRFLDMECDTIQEADQDPYAPRVDSPTTDPANYEGYFQG